MDGQNPFTPTLYLSDGRWDSVNEADGVGGGVSDAVYAKVGDGVDRVGDGVDSIHCEVGDSANGVGNHVNSLNGRIYFKNCPSTIKMKLIFGGWRQF